MTIRLYGSANAVQHHAPYVPVKAAKALSLKKGQLLSVDNNGKVDTIGVLPDTTIGFLTVREQDVIADEVFQAYEITPSTYLAFETPAAFEMGDDLTFNASGIGIIQNAAANKKQAAAVRNQVDSKSGEVVFRIKAVSLRAWKSNSNA